MEVNMILEYILISNGLNQFELFKFCFWLPSEGKKVKMSATPKKQHPIPVETMRLIIEKFNPILTFPHIL